VTVVPNWGSSFNRANAQETRAFRRLLGIPEDAFLAVYGGNIGRAAGVDALIDAMAHLRDEPHLWLAIAGDGPELTAVKQRTLALGLSNVVFRSPWPREETASMLTAADLLLLPTSGAQSGASVPSKLIAYSFAGVPVLAAALADSDTAAMIEEAGSGWTIAPDAPELLAAKILEISKLTPAELMKRGVTGRAYAERALDRNVCVPRVADIIERAAQSR
jgi:glycosyltransferase involved in cell wall biosynthesis